MGGVREKPDCVFIFLLFEVPNEKSWQPGRLLETQMDHVLLFGHVWSCLDLSLNARIDTPLQSHRNHTEPLTFQPFWEARGASSVNTDKGKINFGMEEHMQTTLKEK